MARVKSIVQINGTIGDLTFYTRNGEYLTHKKSSLDGDRVRTDPAFAPSQVRAAEYGGASTIASQLRKGLGPLQHMFLRGRLHTKIVGAIRKGFLPGSTKDGPADFSIAGAEAFLKRLNFSASTKPYEMAGSLPTISTDSKTAGLSLSVSPPPPSMYPITAPPGATHYAFVLYVQPFTDYKFDARTRRYKPSVKCTAQPATHRFEWDTVELEPQNTPKQKPSKPSTPYTVNLGKPKKGVTYLLWWGILFTQKVNKEYVALSLGTNLALWTSISAETPQSPILQKPNSKAIAPQLRQLHELLGISRIT